MATPLEVFCALLKSKSGFEVIEMTEEPSRLRLMGRVPVDKLSVNMNNWLLVVRDLLRGSQNQTVWKADISKSYFLRGPAGEEKVIYGWRVIFQGADIATHYSDMTLVVRAAPQTSAAELTEYPLPGASPDRNSPNRGKGAGSVGFGGR